MLVLVKTFPNIRKEPQGQLLAFSLGFGQSDDFGTFRLGHSDGGGMRDVGLPDGLDVRFKIRRSPSASLPDSREGYRGIDGVWELL